MTCTECKRETNCLKTDYKRRIDGKRVVIIRPDEELCNHCALKRPLYRSLQEIHHQRMQESFDQWEKDCKAHGSK